MKFSIKDFSSKCDQICRKLRIWSHFLNKSFMENFIFCAVWYSGGMKLGLHFNNLSSFSLNSISQANLILSQLNKFCSGFVQCLLRINWYKQKQAHKSCFFSKFSEQSFSITPLNDYRSFYQRICCQLKPSSANTIWKNIPDCENIPFSRVTFIWFISYIHNWIRSLDIRENSRSPCLWIKEKYHKLLHFLLLFQPFYMER